MKWSDSLIATYRAHIDKWSDPELFAATSRKDFKKDLDTLIKSISKEIAEAQRTRDRAIYSINRAKTSIKIKDAMLGTPLVTE